MPRKYAVVTPSDFLRPLQPLLEQKRQRGYEVHVIRTEELVSADPLYKKIREQLLILKPDCVLLVGDDDVVPGYPLTTHDNPPKVFVSDVFLTMDDRASYSGITVGRLSTNKHMRRVGSDGGREYVPLEDQIKAISHALVVYPDGTDSDWQKRIVLTGWNPRSPSHPDFSTDAGHDCLRSIAHYADIVMQFENDKRAPDNAKSLWGTKDSTQEGLKAAIEDGALIVRYLGHGNRTRWTNIGVRENGGNVGRSFVRGLNVGTKQPLVISTTCHTGDLPSSPSFGETWQTELKAIGFFGADDESLTYFNDRLSPQILHEYYANKRTRVGEIINSAIKFVYDNERDGTPHKQKFDQSILMYRYYGDPDTRLPKPNGKKVTLDQNSLCGPAVSTNSEKILLGWRHELPGAGLCFLTSSNGRNFSNRCVLDENSKKSPALTTFNHKFVVAWCDGASGHLNLMQSGDGINWDSKVVLAEGSNSTPALAPYRGHLYLAWRDRDDRLNMLRSRDGISWGGRITSSETTISGPALAAGIWLMLAWRGPDDKLNIMRSYDNQHSFGHKITFDEKTTARPCLHVHQGRPHLAWQGQDGKLNISESRDAGVSWDLKLKLRETSIDGPALGSFGDEMMWFWAGTDQSHRLNVLPIKLRV